MHLSFENRVQEGWTQDFSSSPHLQENPASPKGKNRVGKGDRKISPKYSRLRAVWGQNWLEEAWLPFVYVWTSLVIIIFSVVGNWPKFEGREEIV